MSLEREPSGQLIGRATQRVAGTVRMDGQRQKSGWGRRRRRKSQRKEPRAAPEPVLIAARRPDSPRLIKAAGRAIAASAAPKRPRQERVETTPEETTPAKATKPDVPRRAARIVQLGAGVLDDRERERQKLFQRLMSSQGRGAITRAANDYIGAGFELPDDQEIHLQLLEHFDEGRARESLIAMTRLLRDQPAMKRPVLDQRLRRLEEHADEPATRALAAELRRSLRS